MAGYNNFLPQTYSYLPNVYGAQPLNTANVQTPTAQINWVQGEAGAKSVPVAPGQKILLMDSETNVFYLKSSDPSGMPLPLRIFEYKEVGVNASSAVSDDPAQSTYVTHEELDEILAEFRKPKEKKVNEFDI